MRAGLVVVVGGVWSACSLLDIVVFGGDWPSTVDCTQHACTKTVCRACYTTPCHHISSSDKRPFNSAIKACRLDRRATDHWHTWAVSHKNLPPPGPGGPPSQPSRPPVHPSVALQCPMKAQTTQYCSLKGLQWKSASDCADVSYCSELCLQHLLVSRMGLYSIHFILAASSAHHTFYNAVLCREFLYRPIEIS